MIGRRIGAWRGGLAALVAVAMAPGGGLPGAGGARAEAAAGATWRTAWGTALAFAQPLKNDQDFTCRFIARTTLEGDAVKIRLSNAWGTGPLTIDAATVGIRSAGAFTGEAGITLMGSPGANLTGPPLPVTFGGLRTVTIPAGGSVLSDAVPLVVDVQQDVAVSLHFPGPSPVVSGHALTLTTNYCTAWNGGGDHTTDVSGARFFGGTDYFTFDALDVETTEPGTIVVLGDSITDGASMNESIDCGNAIPSFTDQQHRWTDDLSQILDARPAGSRYGVVNEGIGGNQLTQGGDSGLIRLQRDVLSHEGVTDVAIALGINDLHNHGTNAGLVAGYQQALAIINPPPPATAPHIRVIGMTITQGLGLVAALTGVRTGDRSQLLGLVSALTGKAAGLPAGCSATLPVTPPVQPPPPPVQPPVGQPGPVSAVAPWTPMMECDRDQANGWLRGVAPAVPLATGGVLCKALPSYTSAPRFDCLYDVALVTGGPLDRMLLPQYNSGDFVHPNTLGYQAIAGSFPLGCL